MSREFTHLAARCTDEQTYLHRQRLEALYERDRDVCAETFFRHVPLQDVCEMLGYNYAHDRSQGLSIKKDYHVHFYQSKWRGVRCYHLDWSGIDHVWIDPDDEPKMKRWEH